jgi:glutaminyl-peptide cyclotransferase
VSLGHIGNLPAVRKRAAALVLAVAAVALSSCGGDSDDPGADAFDAERAFDDLRAQVEIGPRPSGSEGGREEVRFIVDRLREAGVKDVRAQRPYANVVGTIPGTENDAIVLGAHHDTKTGISPEFVGANDGASGVAVVLELARVLPDRVEGPSIHLALFDAEEARGDRPFEEDGTRGSRQYVRYAREADRRGGSVQGSPPLRSIGSMILVDMVGDCDLQIPREQGSDQRLYRYISIAAERADGDPAPFVGTTTPILDDHIPFLQAGVTAVDLIDFTYGGSSNTFWHTPEDTLEHVCPESLDAVGEALLQILPAAPGSAASDEASTTLEGNE